MRRSAGTPTVPATLRSVGVAHPKVAHWDRESIHAILAWAVDGVQASGVTEDFGVLLPAHAQAKGNGDRPFVLRMDQTDQSRVRGSANVSASTICAASVA